MSQPTHRVLTLLIWLRSQVAFIVHQVTQVLQQEVPEVLLSHEKNIRGIKYSPYRL